MDERHFILYQDKYTDYQNKAPEVLTAIRVKEILPNGKQKTVYSDIHFCSDSISPSVQKALKSIVSKQAKHRVWSIGRKVA